MSAEVSADVEVRHEPDRSRWAAYLEGTEVGYAEYDLLEQPPRIVLTHTVVDPAFGGRGIAGTLIAQVLDDVRAEGARRVVPACSFVVHHLEKHPEQRDLLA